MYNNMHLYHIGILINKWDFFYFPFSFVYTVAATPATVYVKVIYVLYIVLKIRH